jgi:hypothetical protein
MGIDTKTYRLTDRQSQYDFDFDFNFEAVVRTRTGVFNVVWPLETAPSQGQDSKCQTVTNIWS